MAPTRQGAPNLGLAALELFPDGGGPSSPRFLGPAQQPVFWGGYQATILGDGASAYWRLNDPQAPTVEDSAGTNNGIYGAGVLYGQPGPPLTGDTAVGLPGGANINVSATVPGTSPTVGSIECWFTCTIAGGIMQSNKALGPGNLNGTFNWTLLVDTAGYLRFVIFTTANQYLIAPKIVTNGDWHHVVATVAASKTMSLYLDGVLQGTLTPAGAPGTNAGSYWRVGVALGTGLTGHPTNSFLTGSVAQAAVYPNVLTLAQVQSHYQLGSGALVSPQAPYPVWLPSRLGPRAVGPVFFARLPLPPQIPGRAVGDLGALAAVSLAAGTLALTAPTPADPGSLASGGQSTATLAMPVAYLGALNAAATSTGALVLSRPEPMAVATAAATSTTALALAPVLTGLATAGQSTATATVSTPASLGTLSAPAASSGSLATAAYLGALTVASTAVTSLALSQLLSLQSAASVSSASATVTTPGPVPFVLSTTAASTGSLSVQRPEPLGIQSAGTASTGTLGLTAPSLLSLTSGGQAGATLTPSTPGAADLGTLSTAAVATGTLGPTVRPLLGTVTAGGASTGSVTISLPQPLTLNAAAATATATLGLQTVSGIPLAPTGGQASASLDLFQTYLGGLASTASSHSTATITAPDAFTLTSAGQSSAALTLFRDYLGALGTSANSTTTATVTVTVLLSLPATAASSAAATVSTPTPVALNPASASATSQLDVVATAVVKRWPVSTEPRWTASITSSWQTSTQPTWSASVESRWPVSVEPRWPNVKEPV